VAEIISRLIRTHSAGLLGLLLCALCLAYFYVLDNGFVFGHRHFAPIFYDLLYSYDRRSALLGVIVCVAALLWTNTTPILRLVDYLGGHAGVASIATVLLFAACAVGIYKNYPLSMDEYAAVFQSKVFASGRLAAELPPALVPWLIAPGFNGHFLLISAQTGRAIESYWPGFAFVLAPFQLLGIPWLCNATLAGLAIFLIHRITFDLTGDRRAAGWASLFAIASSAFWANAISYYSMQAHLTANLLYAWLLLKPTRARSFSAGLVGALALLLHNPVPHMLFAAPWLIALARDDGTRRRLIPLGLGYLPAVAVGLGWVWLRNDIMPATPSTSMAATLKSVFVLPDADIFNMRAAAVVKMWVWALPCLFYFAFLGYLRARDNRYIRLLMLSALSTFAGYLFVRFDQGHGWGYRYFHSAWGVVPILAACALTERPQARRGLVAFAGASAVLSLLILVPFQLTQIDAFITSHLAMLPRAKKPGENVYFIDFRGGYYIADMIQMDPLLRSDDLYLASWGSGLDDGLMQRYWPDAVRCGSAPGVVQWCLGDAQARAAGSGLFIPR
jgi:hypothetical protein